MIRTRAERRREDHADAAPPVTLRFRRVLGVVTSEIHSRTARVSLRPGDACALAVAGEG